MSPLSSPRGSAEELQRVLDGTATAEETLRHAGLAATVGLLTAHRAVTPRPEFSADLRQRLMAAAEVELVDDRTAVVRPLRPVSPVRRRFGAVAASLVIVGTSAGVVAAAQGALPGDPLYPVKRGTEQVATSLQFTEAEQGRSVLGHAATRLQEARDLQELEASTPLVTGALGAFRAAAADGATRLFSAYAADQDPTDVAAVRAFAADRMVELEELSEGADPVVAASLVDAADTLADLDEQARVLCARCSNEPDLVTPTAVAAGASAATVDALLARPVAQARLDRTAVEALQLDQLRELRRRAQESAGDTGQTQELQRTVPPAEVGQHGPVASTLTTAGEPTSPTLTDRPVSELVTGITGTGVTGTVRTTVAGTPLEDVASDLEDTVSGVTGGLVP